MSTTTTSEPRFTLDDVLNAARKIVEERGGDYVYNPDVEGRDGVCVYAAGDAPSCLVGHVIHALDPDEFQHLSDRESNTLTSLEAGQLIRAGWLPDNFWTDDAERAMNWAQRAQDSGETWGVALYTAENLGADAD